MQLPEQQRRRKPSIGFGEELRKFAATTDPDNAWKPWPGQENLTVGSRNTYRSRVNSGRELGEGFEARMRAGTLFVRWVGERQ